MGAPQFARSVATRTPRPVARTDSNVEEQTERNAMTASGSIDPEVREKIWSKLQSGELPVEPATHTWGGPSEGRRCAACDQPINKDDQEIEADCVDRCRRFYHRACYVALTVVRASLTSQR